MVRLPVICVGLIVGCFCAPSLGFAQEEEGEPTVVEETAEQELPKSRLYLASLTAARYHPIGLETQNRLMYSHMLYESESMIMRDNFFKAGPSLKLNPAYLKVGPLIDLQPIAILHLRLGYEFVYYFGTFGYLQSYPDPDSDYSDKERKKTNHESYDTKGHHLFAETTLQMRISHFVARSKFSFAYWNVDLTDDHGYFYDATLDTLIPNKKFMWTNDTDLLFMRKNLVVGVRYSGVFPLTEAGHQRIGPIFAWSFHTRDYTRFNRPTLLCILGWYVEHQNRVGGIPYVLVGFSFSTDFLSTR